MQAVILAAGKSSRFYPFSSFGHKSMLPLFGKPLLQHTLESLKKAKFNKVVIVVGKDSDIPQKIENVPGLVISFVVQEEKLGMGHALSQAEHLLDETFFLLSAYHMDVDDFAHDMQKKQKDHKQVILLAKEDTNLEKYGVLHVENDRVISVTEKPEEIDGKRLRLIGIYLLNKTFLQTLNNLPVEEYHFEKALDEYARSGNISFVKTDLPLVTLKHSWDILTVKDYLLSKIKKTISSKAHISKSAIIQGEVIISDNVIILEGACIKGPCFLGENVVVGNNAILRNGVIAEENVVIGATMEVKNSVLMKNVTTHTGFIGDSVIGSYSRLAAGFCSANVRFDRGEISTLVSDLLVNTHRTHVGVIIGEHVDTGINVATMPGVMIGNHATIGPGTMVMENVEDSMRMYTKFETIKKKKNE